MARHLLVKHPRLYTRDREEALDVLGRIWERHRISVPEQPYRIRWHQADLDRASLTYLAHPCRIECTCDGPLTDQFRLLFQRTGQTRHWINGRPATTSAGMAALYAPGQDLRFETATDQSVMMLNLDGDFVRRGLARRFRRLAPIESWAVELPLASARVQLLRSLCEWLAIELDRPASILRTSARVAANFERTLLSAFFECLAERDCGTHRGADVDEAGVALIEAWIDANLDEPIGVEEMAAAVNADVRAVTLAFRRLRGCTPLQALQSRRLDRARRALLAADERTTVTEVATSLGFFHFGRFAIRYRQRFGEKPSDTLTRRRQRSC